MCGIAGIIQTRGDEPCDRAVRAMCEALVHRGPDDAGLASFPEGALGHRRLSILDLSPAGHQPMHTDDGRYTIVYNGEIYNFQELRRTHFGDDQSFRSHSDTEVLLALFARERLEVLDELNGLFGFAVWDAVEKRLYLAVDRFAIKQVYYYCDAERLVFASEVKGILAAGVPVRPDHTKLFEYQLLKRTYGDETFFRGIRRVAPGGYLVFDQRSGQIETGRWYQIEDRLDPERLRRMQTAGRRELEEECEHVLRTSVSRRLLSDAPVGVMCSGGIDSSLTTLMAADVSPNIVAYTAKIPEEGRDETGCAAAVCRHLGIDHHVFELSKDKFMPRLPRAIYHADAPLTFANSIAMYGVCDLARSEGVKVLLTGEGADEIFGGYKKYSAYKRYLLLRRLVRWLPKRGRFLFAQPRHTFDVWRLIGNGQLYPREQPLEFLPGLRERLALEEVLAARLGEACPSQPECRMAAFMLADLYDYLGALLMRQDRMGMWASIESRVPFLDHEVVEFGMHLPVRHKVTISDGKMLLRRLAHRLLPATAARKPKQGFRGLSSGAASPRIFAGGFYETEMGHRIPSDLTGEQAIACGSGGMMWKMLNIELWGRIFVRGECPEELAEEYLMYDGAVARSTDSSAERTLSYCPTDGQDTVLPT